MELIRGLNNWKPHAGGCVATIGNYDGVHLGHQSMFAQLSELAAVHSLPSVVMTFNPLPHEFFKPESRASRLQPFRDRVCSIAACGIDQLLVIRFDGGFAEQTAESFIQNSLIDVMGVRHLLIGDDFRFGRNRSGTIETLRAAESPGSFEVSAAATVNHLNTRVSSTRVRKLMQENDCEQVTALLGRPHRISGRVVHGEKVGRQLGFPTANVALKAHRPLLCGVFAVMAHTADGKAWPAVVNLGERPTIGGRKLLLEVHLLDQSMDLYGQTLAVDFHHFIRGEKKFDSLDDLKAAIAADAETARRYFLSNIS